MSYDLSEYTNLYAAAGNSSSALLNKFPFLCDWETLAAALKRSDVITYSNHNPNDYDEWEMATRIISWFDKHADYATGKYPKAIESQVLNKRIWSQSSFWRTLNIIGTVGWDKGYAVTDADLASVTYTGYDFFAENSFDYDLVNITPPSGYYSYLPEITAELSYTPGLRRIVDRSDLLNVTYKTVSMNASDIMDVKWEMGAITANLPNNGGSDTNSAAIFDQTTPSTYTTPAQGLETTTVGQGTGTMYKSFPSEQQMRDYFSANPDKNASSGVMVNDHPTIGFDYSVGVTNYQYTMSGDPSDVPPEVTLVQHQTQDWTCAQLPTYPNNHIVFPLSRCIVLDDGGYTWTGTENITKISHLGTTPTIPTVGLQPLGDPSHTTNPLTYNIGSDTLYFEKTWDWSLDVWSPTNNVNKEHNLDCIFESSTGTTGGSSAGAGYIRAWFTGADRDTTSLDFKGRGYPYYGLTMEVNNSYTVDVLIPFLALKDWGMTCDVIAYTEDTVRGRGKGLTTTAQAQLASDGTTILMNTAGYHPADFVIDNPGQDYHPTDTVSFETRESSGFLGNDLLGSTLNSNRTNTIANADTKGTWTNSTVSKNPLRDLDVIKGPSGTWAENSIDYRDRAFLGTDYTYEKDGWSNRILLDGSNYFTGMDTTGATPNRTDDHPEAPMYIYSNQEYLDGQNRGGPNQTYDDHPVSTSILDHVSYYSRSMGVFDVTITDGKISAVTPRARLDGDGNSVTGGWDYGKSGYALEIKYDPAVTLPSDYKAPKLFYELATADQPSQGNKSIVNLSSTAHTHFLGENIPAGAIEFMWATGFASEISPSTDPTGNFTWIDDENGYRGFDHTPQTVRVTTEIPALSSTTRSLKTVSVGTGAHRRSFELEFPPLTEAEAGDILRKFEVLKGVQKTVTIKLPTTAIKHLGKRLVDENIQNVVQITGSLGTSEVILEGLTPDQTYYWQGTFFVVDQQTEKVYQILDNISTDQYGRGVAKIEPPLTQTLYHNATIQDEEEGLFVKCHMVDDTLDYTVDAAGHYRLSVKFREAL